MQSAIIPTILSDKYIKIHCIGVLLAAAIAAYKFTGPDDPQNPIKRHSDTLKYLALGGIEVINLVSRIYKISDEHERQARAARPATHVDNARGQAPRNATVLQQRRHPITRHNSGKASGPSPTR